MKKILLHLDSDGKPSVFDQITAYDAGVDQVLAYGGVLPDDVANLVYGVMFTRGGDDLRNSAVFVGGSDVRQAEALFERVLKTFFGKIRVSVMFDANGCNTTAAAAVHKVVSGRDVQGRRAVVLAGTGPVGMRVAALLAKKGCRVALTSRSAARAAEACAHLRSRYNLEVTPVQMSGSEDAGRVLVDANLVVSCGTPGVQLLKKDVWAGLASLEVMADINAVEPLGIEGLKVTDDGVLRDGKVVYGAIAIGNLKMKIHRRAVATLFSSNDLVLDLEEISRLATELGAA